MTPDDKPKIPAGGVDLSNYKALHAMARARDEQQALDEQQVELVRWDRAMTRAFKGIMPRSTRLTFMRAAGKREEL